MTVRPDEPDNAPRARPQVESGDTEYRATPLADALPASVPQRIGPYRILRQIGEGGMAIICEAQQDEPRRRVALKLLKRSIDLEGAAARLEVEREVLSLMKHPNVASIFDAGLHDHGHGTVPYFVMELIEGTPIVDYCTEHGLGLEARLRLMIQACDGIQHAHGRGVIHRDISARNILVEARDATPVVKVIDFGVAKTMWGPLTDKPPVTIAGMLPVTPEYMSPELASGDLRRVGFTSDIFSLGVLLYELITTTLPFGGRRLRAASPATRERILNQETVPPPSQRLAEVQRTEGKAPGRPTWSVRRVQRDLDWIVGKALAADVDRRYQSAANFADDLRAFLERRPVTAGPDSLRYRLRKWFAREPRYAAAMATLAVVATVSVALVTAGYFELSLATEGRTEALAKAERERNQYAASEEKLKQVLHERDDLRRNVYSGQVGSVYSLLNRSEISLAKRALAAARPELRGWEWLYLQGIVDGGAHMLGRSRSGFTTSVRSAAADLVCAGALDGSVWTWDAKTGAFLHSIKHHDGPIVDIRFDAEGRSAVSVGADGKWWRFSPRGGDRLGTGRGGRIAEVPSAEELFSRVSGVGQRIAVLSPDTRLALWVGQGRARVVELETGKSTELTVEGAPERLLEQDERQGVWAAWTASGPAAAYTRGRRKADADDPKVPASEFDTGGVIYWGSDLRELAGRRIRIVQLPPDAQLRLIGDHGGVFTLGEQAFCFRPRREPAAGAAQNEPEHPILHGHEYVALNGHSGDVTAVAASADGRIVATGGGADYRVMLWNLADGAQIGDANHWMSSRGILVGHEASLLGLEFDGNHLLSASADGTVRVWDTTARAWMRRDAVSSGDSSSEEAKLTHLVHRVAFSGDGRRTIATTMFPSLIVTDVETGESSTPLTEQTWQAIRALGSTKTGEQLVAIVRALGTEAGSTPEDRVVRLEVGRGVQASRTLEKYADAEQAARPVWAFSPVHTHLASVRQVDTRRHVVLWAREGGEGIGYAERAVFGEELGEVSELRFSDDGSLLVGLSNRTDVGHAEVLAWDVAKATLRWRAPLGPTAVTRAAFSHKGDRLYVGSNTQRVFVFTTSTGVKHEMKANATRINAIAVSPDDTRILTGSESAWSRIWDVASGQLLLQLPEANSFIPDVAWGPTDRFLAVAGGHDLCVLTYRCGDPPKAYARVLVDQLVERLGTVDAAKSELARMDADAIRVLYDRLTPEEARQLRDRALSMVGAISDDPDYLNSVAWALVYDADSGLDPGKGTQRATAVERPKLDLYGRAQHLSEQALNQRDSWSYRRTLGVALYRQGEYRLAAEHLRKASGECSNSARVGIRLLLALAEYRAATPGSARSDALGSLQQEVAQAEVAAKSAAAGEVDAVAARFLAEARTAVKEASRG